MRLGCQCKRALGRESEARSVRMTSMFFSALGGSRTHNLLIRSQMLYPLSYERGGGLGRDGTV
jgi:hypothetical protein